MQSYTFIWTTYLIVFIRSNLYHILPMKELLVDKNNRKIHKLRISLTDTCDMKCFFCMPKEPQFSSANEWLTPTEIFNITKNLIEYGIDEVKLVGGEPLIREDIIEIIELLSTLPLKKLGLTTNGQKLKNILSKTNRSNCNYINITLNSLNPDRFTQISKTGNLEEVIKSIFLAQSLGFQIKINTVIMQHVLDDELLEFIEFSRKYNIEVRFIELMKIGQAINLEENEYISYKTVLEKIKTFYDITPIQRPIDSTSISFKLNNNATIGFIPANDGILCKTCSKLRIDCTGFVRPCLMTDDKINFRNMPIDQYYENLKKLIDLKPLDKVDSQSIPMHKLGG